MRDAWRRLEDGEDVDEMPPALRPPAPGKLFVAVHVFIIVQQHGFQPLRLLT